MTTDDALPDLLDRVRSTYDRAIDHYGVNHRGVGWLNAEDQIGRLEILSKIFGPEAANGGMTINDLGCGYGIMFEAFGDLPALKGGHYIGYDISTDMLAAARTRIQDPRAQFIESHMPTEMADYGFASGTFNIKMHNPTQSWREYIEETLSALWDKARIGIGFNMTSSTATEQDHTFYYGAAEHFTDYCRDQMSPHVVEQTDYSPSEWTILVRR